MATLSIYDTPLASIDQFEIESDRTFLVEVTTDLENSRIKNVLEKDPNKDFNKIDNFSDDENGKKYFNFKTEPNKNIGPKDFPFLEDKIDELLSTTDAKIWVPGTEFEEVILSKKF